ncbi:hypothetical protein [Nocardioides sp.]|uniref:hypothetical protein n=1 Tax=Nocardioides sp. TaxID=35761 RepID=UPI00260928EF|nr:hypothetical protein [Nocardioides sp.]
MSSSTTIRRTRGTLGAILGLTATAVTALALALPTGATATASEPGDPTPTPTGTPTSEPTEPTSETTQEKGVLIECAGTWKGQPAMVSVYENRTYGNELVVAVGAEDAESFWITDPEGRMVRRGELQQEGRMDGKRVVLAGRVVRDGEPVEVHEEREDAGQHIVVDGVHKPLAADLVLTWKKRNADLDCDNAFRYDLTVTKTPIA